MARASVDERNEAQGLVHASARSLLFTVLGELVYPAGKPVWTASLLYVLQRAGFSEQAARQAIARGVAAGWMVSERRGRETRFRLTPELVARFDEGASRVFAFSREAEPWDGRWLILIISVPNEQRQVRKRLYTALSWAGLGNPTPGVWVTPHTERLKEVERVILELGLRESTVSVMGAPGAVGLSEGEIVRRAWDLESVAARYEELLARFRGLEPDPGDPLLLAHLELTGAVRHLPFVDPQLPEPLLPGWIGREVTKWSEQLKTEWSLPAHARWRAIVETTSPPATPHRRSPT
jgi:phenylacetic acid degradation operon negative regulatory protein